MAVGEFCVCFFSVDVANLVGGGSEEIMSELAIREEVKDLKKLAGLASKI
jgi:hypothetical protein